MNLGLYLHFPFCTNKCAYCDFYKELHHKADEAQFFESLTLETKLAFERLELDQPTIDTLYIGGGTPSLADTEKLAQWLEQLGQFAHIKSGCEFSIECNPESVNRDKLTELKQLGVTRPVFGIQSLDKRLLKKLDRKHNPKQSYEAVYLANALGFKTFGVDLIFGLPGQTSKMLSTDMDQLVDLDPPHVSFYQLTVETDTKLLQLVESGKVKLPDNDLMTAMYSGGVEKFEEAELMRYEVGSFAKVGHQCEHNIGYWSGKNYLGLGPGAHSYISGKRFAVVDDFAEYNRALAENSWPVVDDSSGKNERMAEAILLGLRMTEGISETEFITRFAVELNDYLVSDQVAIFKESGHLNYEDGRYFLSSDGFLVADDIIRRLLK